MKYSFSRTYKPSALILMMVFASSCTKIGNYAEKRADHAAYGNIGAAQRIALGNAAPFTIDDEESQRIRELLERDNTAEEAALFSLADTLAIALANSRSYQTRKEALFIQALNLTEVQKH